MRRRLTIAVLAAAIVLVPCVEAQRGGGRMGRGPMPSGMRGGGRIGPGAMPPGMRGGGRIGPGAIPPGLRGGSPFGMAGRAGPVRIPYGRGFVGNGHFGNSGVFVGTGFHHHGPVFFGGFHHHHFFPNSCFGPFISPFSCGGVFFGSPWIAPGPALWSYPYAYGPSPAYGYVGSAGYGYSSDPGYTDSGSNDSNESESNIEMRREVDRLTGEVETLREQQQASAAAKSEQSSAPERTVLVFLDGRQMEVQNYGISGQTLWVFDEQRARKFPLSELDQKATQEANARRGVTFLAP